jgi:4-diphosphocytidyl-2-C-methyl-D-erythritol kinase
MISFPNAKINIGLSVTGKRSDGYHDLETVFYPVGVFDVLETISSEVLKFTSSGIAIPGDQAANLCVQAYNLLNSRFGVPPVHIHLHKNIPTGAGLGGGSADAAFLLIQLNRQFGLGISASQLEELAGALGADCPFFIRNAPVLAKGRGDCFEPLDLDLSAWYIVIVMPGVHIATATAFQGVTPAVSPGLNELVKLPVSSWKSRLSNCFEARIFPAFPVVGRIKQELYAAGAAYASMSGSGAAVYGLFPAPVRLTEMEERYRVIYPALTLL